MSPGRPLRTAGLPAGATRASMLQADFAVILTVAPEASGTTRRSSLVMGTLRRRCGGMLRCQSGIAVVAGAGREPTGEQQVDSRPAEGSIWTSWVCLRKGIAVTLSENLSDHRSQRLAPDRRIRIRGFSTAMTVLACRSAGSGHLANGDCMR
jgi:hypothetical protein